jgi:hypothetical protein
LLGLIEALERTAYLINVSRGYQKSCTCEKERLYSSSLGGTKSEAWILKKIIGICEVQENLFSSPRELQKQNDGSHNQKNSHQRLCAQWQPSCREPSAYESDNFGPLCGIEIRLVV